MVKATSTVKEKIEQRIEHDKKAETVEATAPEITESEERRLLAMLMSKYNDKDLQDADSNNVWNFHNVLIHPFAFKWIPGTNKQKTLEDWLEKNNIKNFKNEGPERWFFEKKEDATAFEKAWNTRKVE